MKKLDKLGVRMGLCKGQVLAFKAGASLEEIRLFQSQLELLLQDEAVAVSLVCFDLTPAVIV